MPPRENRTAAAAREIEGHFWVPGDRHRHYGKVTFDLSDGVRLHLVDTNFGQALHEDEPFSLAAMHGETLTGRPITALGIYPIRWSSHGWADSNKTVVDAFAETLIDEAHVDSDQGIAATHSSVFLSGLDDLSLGGVVDRGPLWPLTEEPFARRAIEVDVGQGMTLTLQASRHESWSAKNGKSETLVCNASLLSETPRALPAIRETIGVLQDFVLFATRRPSHVQHMSLHSDPEDFRSKLGVLAQAFPRPRELKDMYALALNLRDIDDPAKLIADWFSLRERIGPVWHVFFAALDGPEMLLEDRLLGLLAFAEGYHRALHDAPPLTRSAAKAAHKRVKSAFADDDEAREVFLRALSHANSQTQRDRLLFFIDRALEAVEDAWYVERDVLAARLIHTRNWLVHWGTAGKHTLTDGSAQYELVKALIVVLYINLLRDLGLDAEDARAVIGSGWRLEKLPEDVFEEDTHDEDEEVLDADEPGD